MKTKVNKLPQKRQRSENWLVEDKRLLMDLVKERVNAIENKNTDSNTNARKLAAWSDLCSSFNTMCNGGLRTLAQLKAQWGTIKMAKKKDKSLQRKQLFMTGGGPPPELDPENDNDIYSWLPNEFVTDSNEFDSDQINQVASKHTSKKRPSVPRQHLLKAPVKKKENEDKTNYAASIAKTEVECRKELHSIQMENEKKKSRNLDLEKILILKKIEYYEKKLLEK